MPSLQLPGVDLHYDTIGSGPLLLLITGADGRGSVWKPLAEELSSKYTVAYYDRRGFSQSIINGPENYADRLTIDAEDASKLIAHLSPEVGATVLGNSSGAIVALNLLLNHPANVLKLVCHEPPAFGALPPPHQAGGAGMINHIYDIYRSSGPIAATEAFTAGLSNGEESALMRSLMHPAHSDEIRANTQFWFEFELRQYPTSKVDMDDLLSQKNKFVPAAGVVSGDSMGVAPIATIAGRLGKQILRLPGGHLGFMTDPKDFAKAFLEGIGSY
jgi:pimeloyl-ACP methyl ester carboxylesterase